MAATKLLRKSFSLLPFFWILLLKNIRVMPDFLTKGGVRRGPASLGLETRREYPVPISFPLVIGQISAQN